MNEMELESEAAAALHRCEELAQTWGLRVSVRDSRRVPGLPMRECAGLFVPSVDAAEFGIAAGCGLAAVDVSSMLGLFDPVGRCASTAAHEVAHAIQDALETMKHGPALKMPGDYTPTIWTPSKLAVAGMPVWAGHDSTFLRACVHVAFRLWAGGLPVSLAWTVHHEAYGLSPLSWYYSELRREAEELEGLPIASALQEPPPAAFSALWAADVARAAAAKKNPGSSRSLISLCLTSEEPLSEKS